MKILIVTPLIPPEPGGPSYYSVALQKALEQTGEKVDLIAFKEVRKYPSGLRHILFLYKVVWRARKVDTLIILDTVSVALPAVLAGWLLRKKTIIRTGGDFVWEHYIERTKEKVLLSDFYKESRKFSQKEKILVFLQKNVIFKLVTKIVFNTAWQRDIWEEPYQIPHNKTEVIENSYPTSTKSHTGGDTFLCAWRPTTFKNIETLELAHEQCPEVKLEIVSGISREELHAKMLTARALIIPSLSELGPNMAMEALALGLPVLLTKDCGVHHRLDGAVTWIDPLSVKDIADNMHTLMDNDAYTEAKRMAQEFRFTRTYTDVAHDFSKLYNNLIV